MAMQANQHPKNKTSNPQQQEPIRVESKNNNNSIAKAKMDNKQSNPPSTTTTKQTSSQQNENPSKKNGNNNNSSNNRNCNRNHESFIQSIAREFTPSKLLWKLPLIVLGGIACSMIVWRTGADWTVIAIGTVIVLCLLLFPKTPSRLILKRISTVYNIFFFSILAYLLVTETNREHVRQVLSTFDSVQGNRYVPPAERKQLQCDIFTPNDPEGYKMRNVYNQFLAPWVGIHAFAWLCRYLLIRNVWVTWLLSLVFELFEISYRHVVPDFDECWWDHIFVDVLICNAFGILLGYVVMKMFNMTKYKWKPFSNLRHFIVLAFIYYLNTALDIWTFIWPAGVEVKVLTRTNYVRVFMWFIAAVNAHWELYEWADRKITRLSNATWLFIALVFMELAFVIKYSRHLLFSMPPPNIVQLWYIVGAGLVAVFGIVALINKLKNKNKSKNNNSGNATSNGSNMKKKVKAQ